MFMDWRDEKLLDLILVSVKCLYYKYIQSFIMIIELFEFGLAPSGK